ncbi:flavin monoamine oxidase family protein [Aspergillus aculeatinus CBS 121060]|uniref:Amine oxidase n=1 Tax=Aspergillus aculeatinus CBS 121060 TaxID=1448322 RepID=A0ACD1GZ15_9EURO|nr:amine oxidase [Aspergillus aculeatinus CBS 121060]RAH66721.1 amine oxidase [Aspergillus aculeatinus CBS 121060]
MSPSTTRTARTQDGYTWTRATGVVKGNLRCRGVIEPCDNRTAPAGHLYDVIVIGAGYAGLIAARDLAEQGRSVLLLEARDRIGGRTYTVEEDGLLYEMGGTWVTHHMAYLFKEMIRYKMDRDLTLTHSREYEHDYYTMNVPGATPRKLTHEESGQIVARAWDLFVNVDGQNCRRVCPLPHAQLGNILVQREEVERLDRVSCRERFEEIKHLLTAEEAGMLVALLLHISGGSLENSSLWDMIRSHALMSYSSENFTPIWTTFKLREGQSELARRMFDDAVDHGLQYCFRTAVRAITDRGNSVQVTTTSGTIHQARRVISTIPLNVLRHVEFSPPLSPTRKEAINLGHVNFMTKIHAEVAGPGLASWNGMRFPNLLMFGYGDGLTERGNAHIVGFGKDERGEYIPERDPEKTIDAFQKLHPMEVKKMVFHNWCTDPWSQGGPAWWRPQYMSKYQDELQSRHGNVFFASADWAHGWRAAIDGALEQGSLAAQEAGKEVKQLLPPVVRGRI